MEKKEDEMATLRIKFAMGDKMLEIEGDKNSLKKCCRNLMRLCALTARKV